MNDLSEPTVLANADVSPLRRWIGVGMLMIVGLILIYIGLISSDGPFFGRFLMVLFGMLSFFQARKNYLSSEKGLFLTEEGLFWQNGDLLLPFDEIQKVDRSLFAFRPSNGFSIRTKSSLPISWSPGVVWRFGKSVGIGGVLVPAQTKSMADILTMQLMETTQD